MGHELLDVNHEQAHASTHDAGWVDKCNVANLRGSSFTMGSNYLQVLSPMKGRPFKAVFLLFSQLNLFNNFLRDNFI